VRLADIQVHEQRALSLPARPLPSLILRKPIAACEGAAPQPGPEPVRPLLGGSVREQLRPEAQRDASEAPEASAAPPLVFNVAPESPGVHCTPATSRIGFASVRPKRPSNVAGCSCRRLAVRV